MLDETDKLPEMKRKLKTGIKYAEEQNKVVVVNVFILTLVTFNGSLMKLNICDQKIFKAQ